MAGLPLLALHVGLLVERALHRETIDATVVARWVLSIALLVVLKRVAAAAHAVKSPTLGVAAVLIFALIHAPVAAPEPSLPIAATSFGLALSLAVVDRQRGALSLRRSMIFMPWPSSPAWSPIVSREVLRDRAPPATK